METDETPDGRAHRAIASSFDDLAQAAVTVSEKEKQPTLRSVGANFLNALAPANRQHLKTAWQELVRGAKSWTLRLRKYDLIFGGTRRFLELESQAALYWRLRRMVASKAWSDNASATDLYAAKEYLSVGARKAVLSDWLNDFAMGVTVLSLILVSVLTVWFGSVIVPAHRFSWSLASVVGHLLGLLVGLFGCSLVVLSVAGLAKIPSRTANRLALLVGVLSLPAAWLVVSQRPVILEAVGLGSNAQLGAYLALSLGATLTLVVSLIATASKASLAYQRISFPESFLDARLRRALHDLDFHENFPLIRPSAEERKEIYSELESAKSVLSDYLPRFFSGSGVEPSKVLVEKFGGAVSWLQEAQLTLVAPSRESLPQLKMELEAALVSLACQDWKLFPRCATQVVARSSPASRARRFASRLVLCLGWAALAYVASIVAIPGLEDLMKTTKLLLIAGSLVTLLSATEELVSPDGVQNSIAKDMLGRIVGKHD